MSSEDTGSSGTTTWIFYPSDTTNKRMFSAAHVYHACDRGINTVINNDHMEQDGTNWGTPQDGDAEQDWIATKENHLLNNYDETVDDEDYGRLPMDGAVANYDFYVSNSKTVYQQGVETGKTSGTFKNYNVTSNVVSGDPAECVTLEDRGVRVESNSEVFGQGDSGGPIYDTFTVDGTRKAAIVGMGSIGYNQVSTGDCYGGKQWTRVEGIESAYITEQGWDAPTN